MIATITTPNTPPEKPDWKEWLAAALIGAMCLGLVYQVLVNTR